MDWKTNEPETCDIGREVEVEFNDGTSVRGMLLIAGVDVDGADVEFPVWTIETPNDSVEFAAVKRWRAID